MKRPWISPEDVKNYTDHQEVKDREDSKLKFDITRAEMKIIGITNNHFDSEKYDIMPEEVELATILVAEAYAKNAVEKTKKRIKSETYDDYSYELESSSDIDISGLDIEELLHDHMALVGRGNTVMRLRKL